MSRESTLALGLVSLPIEFSLDLSEQIGLRFLSYIRSHVPRVFASSFPLDAFSILSCRPRRGRQSIGCSLAIRREVSYAISRPVIRHMILAKIKPTCPVSASCLSASNFVRSTSRLFNMQTRIHERTVFTNSIRTREGVLPTN